MISSTKDQVKEAFHEMKGAVKEIVGLINDDPLQKAEGVEEKAAGKYQGKAFIVKPAICDGFVKCDGRFCHAFHGSAALNRNFSELPECASQLFLA